jgi:hypothetical protein
MLLSEPTYFFLYCFVVTCSNCLYCSDRINYVSEAQRTMWESRGIRHDLGRCDRQRVHEHCSFASLRRKYESLLEGAATRDARAA